MMNYEGLLSQLTDEKLVALTGSESDVQEGSVEEEQAAAIQTVPRESAEAATRKHQPNATSSIKSETSTPQRKISASSRFMNAFTQLYGGANTNDANETEASASRTPKAMESKFLSMWHNMKYGWSGKIRTNFSKEQPVWLLGRCYHRRYTPPLSMENSAELNLNNETGLSNTSAPDNAASAYDSIQPLSSSLYPVLNPQLIDEIVVPQELGMDAADNQVVENPWEEGIEGFRRDFYSRLWMTYRREFPTMNGSNYTSDCGWGCMLRSGQMLLAQGLICHFLGRSWRFDPETQLHSTYEDNTHKKIVKWFGDSSSKCSPFSIHAMVRLGEELGKKPGDWYGPASVSYLLKHALENAALENPDFDNIGIYVARDCTIYMQDVEDLCCIRDPEPAPNLPWQTARKNESAPNVEKQHWKSLIVLIPLRLGTEKLNLVYAHCLKLLLSTEYCIGIIGGRPKHSLYFVGFQEDKLIHLDPHYCQEMVDVNQENFCLNSFHCKSPRKLKSSKMDPSCCIGFYCATKTDFDSFVESVQLYLHPMRCASGAAILPANQTQQQQSFNAALNCEYMEINYPLFTFSRGRCLDHAKNEMSDSLYKPLQQQLTQLTQELGVNQSNHLTSCDFEDDDETEEFVLL